MTYSNIPLAQTVVHLCKAKQVKHIIISPGSRNAPLIIGFTNDPYFKCYSIVDERCAAFFALGIAQQLSEPVAVVCTSGSALLNYYPAISEAFYSRLPLVVVSADRPKHLIGIGDGQTINQKNVFENHILYSANLKLDLKDEKNIPASEDLPMIKTIEDKFERFLGLQKDIQTFNEESLNTAINMAILKKGPVHINVPFDEPLYETVDALLVSPEEIKVSYRSKPIDDYIVRECLEDWNAAKRKLILVGCNTPETIAQEWLDELYEDDSVMVMTETTSNLHHPGFFPNIDQIIAPLDDAEKAELQPDILLTFGGMIVSKKIKALLRRYQPKQHWHIDPERAYDTFFCLTRHIEATPDAFFRQFLPELTHYVKSTYREDWTIVKNRRNARQKEYIQEIPFTDLKVFHLLVKSLPPKTILQSSNSSTIRYLQLFNIKKSIAVYCNRGTSGIDGSTSTAIGCATVSEKQTIFITGDLSFFYDSNALWNNYIPNNFRIILINNQGGGIFRILPGHKNTQEFDTYFETTHPLNARELCQMYNFTYQGVSNETDLKQALPRFYSKSKSPKLLEIFTPRLENDRILLNYFDFIK